MQIKDNVPLSQHCTMRLGGPARYFVEVESHPQLRHAVEWAEKNHQQIFVLGDGSNTIFTDAGWPGLVILMQIMGIEILEDTDTTTTVKLGAGHNWDNAVKQLVEWGLSGVEALSLIPGTVGATPVQNVGAYGQEIADTFVELEAFDLEQKRLVVLGKTDCQFGYRHSIFKDPKNRRYIITTVTLRLNKAPLQPPFYESLQSYLSEHHISDYSPASIRDAVMAIRSSKLPDPRDVANTGSFFKNPLITRELLVELQKQYPDIPNYAKDEMVKIPAGWLVEKAGFANYRHPGGMGTYPKHALVFVNYAAKDYGDLEAFKSEVVAKVAQQFKITLEQEPELITS